MRRTTAARAMVLLAALVLGGCGGGGDADEGSGGRAGATTSSSSSAVSTTTTGTAGLVDIGDGRELYLQCQGEGTPTFVLESGDENGSAEWQGVLPDLAAQTRTCAYDRLGTGSSRPATGCRGLDDLVGDLEALLAAADVAGPYVFVGASGGGYLAAEMAARHPDETAGLATLDTFKAIETFEPGLREQLACDAPTNVEHRDYVAVEHEVWDDRAQIGDFPLTVFSTEYGPAAQGDEIANVQDQQGWFVLTPDHRQVVVEGTHAIAFEEPELVVTELLDLLDRARS